MKLDFSNSSNSYLFYPDSEESGEMAQIQGARWSKADNCWQLPPVNSSLYSLERLYGPIPRTENVSRHFIVTNDIKKVKIPELETVLYEYQKEAVYFLVHNIYHGALLSLSPGLGKTLVSITAANQLGVKKVLVICPLILTRTWADEIMKWANQESIIVHGAATCCQDGWVITNYDSVVNHASSYLNLDWDLVICDESILLKTRGKIQNGKVLGTKRVAILKNLAAKTPRIWLLSGSPVSKHADDLYSQFNVMLPGYFKSYWKFVNEYCYTQKTPWGTKITGTRRNIDFVREFSDIMFRRNKETVLNELPDMQFETYTVDLNPDQQKVHDQLEDYFIAEMDELGDTLVSVTNALAKLIRLQQVTSNLRCLGDEWSNSSSKMDLLIQLVQSGELDEPALIWMNWRQAGLCLYNALNEIKPGLVGYIYGSTPVQERAEIIKDFKAGKIKYLIISLGVGKYGLTLTEAKTIIYFDKTLDGDAYLQSLDRVHRIGLDHHPLVISIVANSSSDKFIHDNLRDKAFSMAKITGSEMANFFRSLKSERTRSKPH